MVVANDNVAGHVLEIAMERLLFQAVVYGWEPRRVASELAAGAKVVRERDGPSRQTGAVIVARVERKEALFARLGQPL